MEIQNKKGEVTTKQLVTLIVLIASFLIILFFIFSLDLGGTTDEQICRNSVVLKGKIPLAGPLDCKTNYVTIETENKEEVMKIIADKMASCWYMFGEGKIDYSSKLANAGTVSCSVCSILEFDTDIQNTDTISYQEFYNYLKNTKKTESQTYLQYLYSTNDLNFFSQEFNPSNYLSNNLKFNKQYFILTGITQEGSLSYAFSFRIFPESASQPVIILEKTQENYERVGCSEFLTKA